MPTILTTEQVLALAPDPASAKSGKDLATPRKWLNFAVGQAAAWGECQGSGATPYRTSVDLGEIAFRCTCPSRKFPCKHGLGLLLLIAAQPPATESETPPDWVREWLDSRAAKAQKRSEKAAEPGDTSEAPDPARAAKAAEAAEARAAQRDKRVAAGIEDLDLWLRDLIRHGLAQAQTKPYRYWDGIAARLVDAQAPGLARMVREMGGTAASGDGWQGRLLERIGRLHLLLQAYKRLDTLPVDTQADVRAHIGFPQSQEELLSTAGIVDLWRVVGVRVAEEERLRVMSIWLHGVASDRFALILQFAHGTSPFELNLPLGTGFHGELVFFPSATPLRALLKSRAGEAVPEVNLPGYPRAADAVAQSSTCVSRNPWQERFPFALKDVVPQRDANGWSVRDTVGAAIPLSRTYADGWTLLAISGGHAIDIFGEWKDNHLLPITVAVESRWRQV